MRRQFGFSAIELMASLVIMSTLFVSVTSMFVATTRRSHDNGVIMEADERARELLDLLAYDIRMAGSGMPMGQASFAVGGTGLGDAPLPILLSATASSITLRTNETGKNTVLTTNFTPSSTALTFDVLSVEDLYDGSVIYISDLIRGGTQGLRAVIDSISGNSITIDSGFITSSGTSFSSGCTVTRITDVTYTSTDLTAGITRDNGEGAITLAPKSLFVLSYLDGSGNPITLPLTDTAVSTQLTSINITVQVAARTNLKDGSSYIATVAERVALRNINLNR